VSSLNAISLYHYSLTISLTKTQFFFIMPQAQSLFSPFTLPLPSPYSNLNFQRHRFLAHPISPLLQTTSIASSNATVSGNAVTSIQTLPQVKPQFIRF